MPPTRSQLVDHPLSVASSHALYPVEDPTATHALTAHTKTKHFMRRGVQQDLLQIGNAAKVMYCTVESANTSHIAFSSDLGFPSYAGDDNLYLLHITPVSKGGTSFPVYYLPWAADANYRMQLKPSPHAPALDPLGATIDPDVFVTAAVQGCSIFVEGSRQQPVVYHLNATGLPGDLGGSPLVALPVVRAKVQDMTRRYNLASVGANRKNLGAASTRGAVHMSDYMPEMLTDVGMNTLAARHATPPWTMSSLLGAYGTQQAWPFQITLLLQFGTIFGVRKAGDWSFYAQTRTRIEYDYEALPWYPGGARTKATKREWVAAGRRFWP